MSPKDPGSMMPAHTELKDHCKKAFILATSKATDAFNDLLKSLEDRSPFDALYTLAKEEERMDKEIEKDAHPYYRENFGSEKTLVTQFMNRALLLQVNESEDLVNSVFLGKYHNLLLLRIHELHDLVPAYSFEEFKKGVSSPFFLNLPKYYNVPEKDYYQIREWQSKAIIKIIIHDYRLLIKKIQKEASVGSSPSKFLQQELHNARHAADSPGNALEIKNRFTQIFCFKDIDVASFKDELLLQHLEYYKSEKLELLGLSHAELQKRVRLISTKPATVVGNEVTIYFVLSKIIDWLEKVCDGMDYAEKVNEPDYLLHLEESQNRSALIVAEKVDEIERYAYDETKDKLEIKDYLLGLFDEYRKRFNAFDEKYFFYVLRDEKSHLLKRLFINNCFFSGDIEGQRNALEEAIVLQDILWAIVQIHNAVFDTHKMDDPGENDNSTDLLHLASEMVLNKELYEKMHNSLQDFIHQFHAYMLPFEVHLRNQRDTFQAVFEDSIERLQEILDTAHPSNKIMYLQARLKNIRQNELADKIFALNHRIEARKSIYEELFKELLLLEAEYMKETKNLSFVLPSDLAQQIDGTAHKQSSSLDALINAKKMEFITNMLEDIGITNNGQTMISERKKGAIRGVALALRDSGILPNVAQDILCNLIAKKINLSLKTRLGASTISDEVQTKANKYIKVNWLAR